MTERRFEFTREQLEGIQPTEKRQYFYDTESDLELMVTPKGVKTFYAYKWNRKRGAPDRSMVGRFGDITIHQARRECSKLTAKFAVGLDPNAEKRALRAEMTLGELYHSCMESDYRVHNKTWPEYERMFTQYLAHWKNRPISEISRSHVQTLHARLGKENGCHMANRVLQFLRSMLNKAVARGWEHPNPAQGVRMFREQSRDRFIEADELPRFFKAVYEEKNEGVRDFVLLALLTGARRGNVLAMRWEDINLARAEWRIPETKNGESQRVALVGDAIRILQTREGNGSEFVFPSSGISGHLLDVKKGWARILKRAEIDNLRMHDLRRTLGSWQAAGGTSLHVIGKSLGHKTSTATAIYARLNLDPVRSAVESATNAMLVAGGVRKAQEERDKEESKIIPFQKAKSVGGI